MRERKMSEDYLGDLSNIRETLMENRETYICGDDSRVEEGQDIIQRAKTFFNVAY